MLTDSIFFFFVVEVYNMVINQKEIILSSSQSLNPLLNEVKRWRLKHSLRKGNIPWLPESHLLREESCTQIFIDLNPKSSAALENQHFLLDFLLWNVLVSAAFCQVTSIFLRLNSAQFRVDQQGHENKPDKPAEMCPVRMLGFLHGIACTPSSFRLSLSSVMKYTHRNTKHSFLLLLFDDNDAQKTQMKQRTLQWCCIKIKSMVQMKYAIHFQLINPVFKVKRIHRGCIKI